MDCIVCYEKAPNGRLCPASRCVYCENCYPKVLDGWDQCVHCFTDFPGKSRVKEPVFEEVIMEVEVERRRCCSWDDLMIILRVVMLVFKLALVSLRMMSYAATHVKTDEL